MPNASTHRSIFGEGWVAFALGAAGILAYAIGEEALAYAHDTWWQPLLLHIIRDLGIAFLVGGIVSLGIERISRNKMQKDLKNEFKEIEQNVLNSAYQKSYPEAYTSSLMHMLQDGRLCRIGFAIDFDIIVQDSDEELHSDSVILLEQVASGRVRNISNSAVDFEPRIFLGKDWDAGTPELLFWKVEDRELDAAGIQDADASGEDQPLTKWYKFPTKTKIAPDDEVYTQSRVRNFKRARDITTWTGLLPSDGVRLTVTHPENIEVFVHSKAWNRGTDFPLRSDGRRVTLDIRGGTLPCTSVEIGWRPVAKKAASRKKPVPKP